MWTLTSSSVLFASRTRNSSATSEHCTGEHLWAKSFPELCRTQSKYIQTIAWTERVHRYAGCRKSNEPSTRMSMARWKVVRLPHGGLCATGHCACRIVCYVQSGGVKAGRRSTQCCTITHLQGDPIDSKHLSICPSVYLSIFLSVHLSICPSFYLSIFLSVKLSICPSFYLSIFLSVHLSICPSFYLSIFLSVHLSIFLSVHLSICPSFYLSIFLSVHLSICVVALLCVACVVVCCCVLWCVVVCCCVCVCCCVWLCVCCCVLLCVVVCVVCVVCCVCVVCFVCCVLCVVRCALCVVHCALCVVHCALCVGVVVVVVVVVAVAVGVVVVGVGVTPAAFLLGSVVAENRQIGGVFACFCNSRSKKHRKYRCFWRVGSPKPQYLRCFLPLVVKNTVFTVFFGRHLAKTLVFTEVSPCSKMWFLDPKRTNIL